VRWLGSQSGCLGRATGGVDWSVSVKLERLADAVEGSLFCPGSARSGSLWIRGMRPWQSSLRYAKVTVQSQDHPPSPNKCLNGSCGLMPFVPEQTSHHCADIRHQTTADTHGSLLPSTSSHRRELNKACSCVRLPTLVSYRV
jgi:hypothetical protein